MKLWFLWDVYRFALHVPVGMALYWMCKDSPAAGISFACWFLAYELNEDRHLSDKAHIDIQGAIGGVLLAWGLDKLNWPPQKAHDA